MSAWDSWKKKMEKRVSRKEEGVPWFVENKVKSYDFVKEIGIKTPKLFYLMRRPEELLSVELPERFVCKPATLSSSQGVLVLKKNVEGVYVNQRDGKEVSLAEIVAVQNKFRDKSISESSEEYGLIIEEWVAGEGQLIDEIPYDYKFFCYGDKVVYVAQYNRNTRKSSVNWFKGEFESEGMGGRILCDWKYVDKGVARVPGCSKELVQTARKLSRRLKTPFVRVDMYATVDGPVFGEFTLTPGAAYYGDIYQYTDEFDAYCGLLWQAERMNIDLDSEI
ncbi:hypothetical protein NIZ92_17760 [Alcaligenes sp. 1735tsa3]|uniref:ATP-grasp fold amidoligase family protein n=1 Tax=Alcaligenes sp. 1735tsa3 TaxID=2953809 RepID=UPI0020A6E398|nr:ATP-grasp fold amidoligase family protein [Alcaligenes sp. 1735tsa3]USY25127.1 hypothetical protein NIZ92_17760 [Alcaligenes sp. 1735tsa3]